jgi:hypothetical protein
MLITDMTPVECQQMMTRTDLGRLGCARNDQPYIVPIYFAYESEHLYGFTTVGTKIEWMRTNPKVCVEFDEIVNHFRRKSVTVTGRYQELPNTPELRLERLHALKVLRKRRRWWQIGLAAKQLLTRHQVANTLFFAFTLTQ